jgi:hypothetical protein
MSEHAGRASWARASAAGGLRRIAGRLHAEAPPAAAPDPRVDELLAAQAALQRQVDELRQAAEHERRLGTTAHERAACWPQRLEELRASEAWARAYAEPEPLVTVRIATWNRADLLVERALSSLRAQGYERWEAIVVGDACTDDTAERLAALGDPRVRFINLPLQGPYPDDPHERWLVAGIPPMNVGARLAEGTWIAPLDDDDEWEPDHLEVLLAAARREEAELAYGRLRGVHHDPPVTIEIGHWPPRIGDFGFQAAIYNAALRDFGYDAACRHVGEPGDWNLARRMWEAGVRFTFVDRIVTTWHVQHGREEWFRMRAAEG